MSVHRAGIVLVTAAVALAGCGGAAKDQQVIDPNALPTNYRSTLVAFLRQSLTNRADFRGAMISEPVLSACSLIPAVRSRRKRRCFFPAR
jgi:hypothetical protein